MLEMPDLRQEELTAHTEYNQLKRQMHVEGRKAEGAELFKFLDSEAPATDRGTAGFGVCRAGFWSCFGTRYTYILFIYLFGMEVCILCFCILEVCNL